MGPFVDLLLANSLTRLVFLPTLLCLPLLFFRRDAQRGVKVYALCAGLLELLAGIWLVWGHFPTEGGFTAVRETPLAWIPSFGISYEVAMDGISMPLVLLTVLLLPLVVLGSWKGIDKHWRGFAISLLLLTTGMLGALVALDLFLFYIFWEVMLIPMYLLIGIWGGQRRIYAAVKFFLFTMAGSLLMLLAILWLAWTHCQVVGVWSFSYPALLGLELPLAQQMWLFGAFALAFAIKVPMFPLHTWLPDAHVEAPTGGSVILAGVLLKLGTYGFLRFALPLFPHASQKAAPLLMTLAVIGILYGALVSWMQTDMKKLVAYSSVAHLGFVMLGLFAFDLMAWQGALLQMVNHGLSTGALFLLVGMLYDRRHTKEFAQFGGLAKVMPWFAFLLVFAALASVGLPALNGFAGEFLILLGTFKSASADLRLYAALASFGVVLAAIYLLKMVQLTIWGPLTNKENEGLADLSWRERWCLIPLCVLMLWIGVAPQRFLAPSQPALAATLESYRQRLATPVPREPILRVEPAGMMVDASPNALVAPSNARGSR